MPLAALAIITSVFIQAVTPVLNVPRMPQGSVPSQVDRLTQSITIGDFKLTLGMAKEELLRQLTFREGISATRLWAASDANGRNILAVLS